MTTAGDVRDRWGEQLRAARLARRDNSQAAAAAATGLATRTVSKAETGQGSADVYDRLARHYGITLTLGAQP